MEDIIEKLNAFMKAQQAAEKEDRQDFACPLCGGEARWSRAPGNNHLHCGCKKCGFRMME